MKIATWNVNSLRVRLPHVLEWLQAQQPDVLALQEIKMTDDQFPVEQFNECGYQAVWSGQKTYNGVAIVSKHPTQDVVTDFPGWQDDQRRILAATIDGVRIVNFYVPNGESVASDKYQYKLAWLKAAKHWLAAEFKQHDKMIVLGDFNIAPEDRDVHDPAAWQGQVLCSDAERAALTEIMALGFVDSLRLFEQEAGVFSWWDYRAAAFRRNMGMRIDLLLVSAALQDRCRASYVDKQPRKLERPSDHAPVILELT